MIKLRLVFLLFAFFFALVILRLFYIQIIDPLSSSSNEYLKYRKILPQRGKIFDRNKEPMAVNQTKFNMYVEPKKMKDKGRLVEKLDDILKIGEATLEAKIDESKVWVAVTSNLTKEQKDLIEKLKFPEIGFNEDPQRYYPEASLAAHLMGFVGKNDKSENVGYFGVEGYYDKELGGLPGILKTERDLLGRAILLGNQEKIEPENGHDIILTIDKSVQKIAKEKLKSGIERYKAKEGCVIVANPYTMEILGLTCLPDFDVEQYYKFSESYFTDHAISSIYEPGSTFKPLVVAAAIQEKKIKPDDFYNETGPVQFGQYKIKTWNDKYEGKISITRILEKSSNVGMVYIGKKLGDKNVQKYVRKYGFGANTEIDLQGEAGGVLKPDSEWRAIDYATATFGQGLGVTPIQMVTAFSSLVNGGELLRPHVVKSIIAGGDERQVPKKETAKILDEKTSEIIKRMLVNTVEHGEYKWARPEGYSIGGKTGTAQIPVQGKYDPSKTIASFIGFAPADRPKFITLVVLKEPKTSIYGSETAAPLFFEIAKDLLVYYNIAPTQ